jgi:exodeoxyribonuclease-5
MQLTIRQEEGLRIAVDRFNNREPYTCIAGYAGSGKSTLIRFIIAALGLEDWQVAYVAFTGKAAKVLSQKGCPNATTAHKLLYWAAPTPQGTFIFKPKPNLGLGLKLIVVDEVSMLPRQMWELLLKHRIYILATGDPGQLPPINPDDDNHVLDKPHVFLDEIMRQAQESEIIRLSMHIREGKTLATFDASRKEVMITDMSQITTGMYEWADQILCATNARRNDINQAMRTIKGFGAEPEVGDKVISLRNHWNDFSNTGNALTNGTIGYIEDYTRSSFYVPRHIYEPGSLDVLCTTVKTEDEDKFEGLWLDYKALTTGEKTLSNKQEYQMNKYKSCPDAPYEFVYGYAITCHKAQGSEWSKVLVFEERFPFSAEDHKRWLYTACTRASEKLVIVKK